MPLRSTGTVHYFCDCQTDAQSGCVAGNDSNDGLSPSTPKRTLTAAATAFNEMAASDTIAFCQGGSFTTSSELVLRNGACAPASDMRTAANSTTCDVRDYPPSWGGSAKPIIRQTAGVNLFNFSDTAGVRVLNLDLEGGGGGPGAGANVGQRGINVSTVSDFLICNNTFNAWFLGIHQYPYAASQPRRVDIWGNRFTLNDLDAFLGGGPGGVMDANYFENNGVYSATTHAVYLQGLNVTNYSVVNNQFRYPTRTCAGVIFVVHDQFDGLNVENNFIEAPSGSGCWGMSVAPGGYGNAEWYRNLTIRRNLIVFAGWGAIAFSTAPHALIENNVIVSSSSSSESMGIVGPLGAARTSPADDMTTDVQIRNNTLYYSSSSVRPRAIVVPAADTFASGEGSGHVIANNSVYMTNGGTCFTTTMGSGAYAFIGNNACYNGTWGSSFDRTTHVTADPQYASPGVNVTTAAGFTPGPSSPLLGGGTAAWAPTYDEELKLRPDPPSIGALEH